jgi:superfamily II DNA or RNA helicase
MEATKFDFSVCVKGYPTMLSAYNKVLTHLGYAIKKSSLTPAQIDKIRKELTVSPKQMGRYAGQADSWPVFQESAARYYLPRMWGLAEFGEAEASTLVEGNPIREDLKFVGKPYDYQTAIINNFVASPNGLICVPCGRGKTFMAISIAARIGRKFMVIVDKEFLLQQWSGELQALMPGIRIGVIQENKKQIGFVEEIVKTQTIPELKEELKALGLKVGGTKDELLARLAAVKPVEVKAPVEYDCCIAMIQTLVQRDFDETDFRSFGFAIFDECHHLGASNFSRALFKVQTKSMLGLSATPTRDDGLTKVFEWFLGKPVYWEKVREADPDVIVRKVDFSSDDDAYSKEPVDFRGDVVLATLLTQILDYEPRNEAIDELMRGLIAEKERRILVLSDRITHLERIERGIAKHSKGTSVGYYIGGMKEEVREEGARTARVLLGTYAMASEAMNIKTLNTMIMVSPRKKIEQSTGRILRVQKDARTVAPLIVDIVDSHGVYQGQWLKRRAYYKKCAYKITDGKEPKVNDSEKVIPDTIPIVKGRCMMVD